MNKTRLNSEFAGKDIYMIRVESIQSGHSVVDNRGRGSGDAVDVIPGPYDSAYKNEEGKGDYHAIVVPCGGDDSAVFLKVTVSWKNDDHPFGETTPFFVTGRPAFEAGKRYIYNLTIGKDKVELGDVTVADWGDNVDLGGGNDEYEAGKLSDPISMTDLRSRLKAWNEANPSAQKSLADMITKELLDEFLSGNGELIISGEFDNSGVDYYVGMSETYHTWISLGLIVDDLQLLPERIHLLGSQPRDAHNLLNRHPDPQQRLCHLSLTLSSAFSQPFVFALPKPPSVALQLAALEIRQHLVL